MVAPNVYPKASWRASTSLMSETSPRRISAFSRSLLARIARGWISSRSFTSQLRVGKSTVAKVDRLYGSTAGMNPELDPESIQDAVLVRWKNRKQTERTKENFELYGQIREMSDGDVEGVKQMVS
jgi:hypothetical protein